MKNTKLLKPILCEGIDLAESLNIYLEEICRLPGPFDHKEVIGSSVIIWYQEEEKREKPMWKVMREHGIKHCCGECNHLIRNTKKDGTTDKRKMYCPCEHLRCEKRVSDPACDTFYLEMFDQIESGNVRKASPKNTEEEYKTKIGA